LSRASFESRARVPKQAGNSQTALATLHPPCQYEQGTPRQEKSLSGRADRGRTGAAPLRSGCRSIWRQPRWDSLPRVGDSLRLERLQVLGQIVVLLVGQFQSQKGVVVVDDLPEARKPAIVVEAPLLVAPESREGCGSVHVRRRPVGLEAVDADLAR